MSNDTEIILKAEDVRRHFVIGRHMVPVLKGVSCEIKKNETVAVVGSSGAGKSTIMHIFGGLDKPTAGRVMISGEDLYGMSAAKRTRIRATGIGFVFQSYHLLPEMDVLENVLLPARAISSRESFASIRKRGMDLLDLVGLADRAIHTPLELSGGEQQRVALARALMNEPDLVLADEPTGNLDAETSDQVIKTLFTLTRDRGHTLVLVTHNLRIAGACDRTLSLEEGVLKKA